MSDLEQVRDLATSLIATHLGPDWTFAFDHAKRRAGLCNYAARRISLSRYLTVRYDDDTNEQTLLHEIAHAVCGPGAGHGPQWKRTARALGYRGERTLADDGMTALAPWVGVCPAGHTAYRHRRPSRVTSCARCSPRFDARHAFAWSHREISAEMKREAMAPQG